VNTETKEEEGERGGGRGMESFRMDIFFSLRKTIVADRRFLG
jgi:hypothetical protein